MTALFVTATGTDIGKSFVTAGIIRELRRQGRAVAALKPVMSGFAVDAAEASDAGILLTALGKPVDPAEIDRIAPWRFAAPLSPDMAAAKEGRSIAFETLVGFSRQAIATAQDALLIEGVGGVMVPLDDRRTVLDWIAAIGVPALLVAGSYLGTISHTLTALDSLFVREMNVLAVIVSETPGSTVPLEETVAAISRFAEPVIALPRARPGAAPDFGRLFGG